MERCELCALPIGHDHAHLLDLGQQTITCACEACATLFDVIDGGRYRRIRPSVRRLFNVEVGSADWASLGIPVGLAFVTCTSAGHVLAGYPGPAGATLATVDRPAWEAVAARYPALQQLAPDVEAWLVNRTGAELMQYCVSIDHCYRLAGLIRTRWRGLGGGPDVSAAIADFFRALAEQAA